MPHPVVHIELKVSDAEKSRHWYEKVFGWKTQYDPNLKYTTFSFGDDGYPVGGGLNADANAPTGTIAYFATDSVANSLAKAKAEGAEVVVDATPIPNMGMFAIFKDPDGNMLGLFSSEGVNK